MSRPIFFDPTGRRGLWARRLLAGALLLILLGAIAFATTLVAVPSEGDLALPTPAACGAPVGHIVAAARYRQMAAALGQASRAGPAAQHRLLHARRRRQHRVAAPPCRTARLGGAGAGHHIGFRPAHPRRQRPRVRPHDRRHAPAAQSAAHGAEYRQRKLGRRGCGAAVARSGCVAGTRPAARRLCCPQP